MENSGVLSISEQQNTNTQRSSAQGWLLPRKVVNKHFQILILVDYLCFSHFKSHSSALIKIKLQISYNKIDSRLCFPKYDIQPSVVCEMTSSNIQTI